MVSDGKCPAGAPTLTIWADDTRTPVLVELAPKVLSETGVCLDVQELAFGDIRTKISLSAPAGEGPDMFVGAHDWLGELTANGVVAPMDLGAKAPDFDPVSVTAMTYDGTLYGLPYAVEAIGFFCNADLVPTPPTTYDEVQAMSQEAKDAGTLTQFLALQTADPYHNEPVNTAFGGYIFGTSDKGYEACDVGLDSEGAIAYLTWLDTMVKAGLLDPNVDGATAETLFKEGKAGCMITGPWNVGPFQEAGVNFTMSPFPTATQDGSPFVGVQGFFINAFSPDKVLAQSFLQDYIATTEVQDGHLRGWQSAPCLHAGSRRDGRNRQFVRRCDRAGPSHACHPGHELGVVFLARRHQDRRCWGRRRLKRRRQTRPSKSATRLSAHNRIMRRQIDLALQARRVAAPAPAAQKQVLASCKAAPIGSVVLSVSPTRRAVHYLL